MSAVTANLRNLVACAALGAAWSAASAEEIPEFFTPVRPAGMGGAFTAVANDESAVWTNPAGIGRTRKARSRAAYHVLKLPNIVAGANSEGQTFYQGFSAAQEKSVEGVVAAGESIGDKPFWTRAAVFPVAIFDTGRQSPMAFGLFSNNTAKAVVQRDTPEQARIEAISDLGAVVGFGLTNASNRFNVGLTFRPVMRYAYEDTVASSVLVDRKAFVGLMKEKANKATGLGVDAGVMYTLADFWYPTIGVSVLNLPTGCKSGYLNPFTERVETVCGNVYRGSIANEDALSTVDPMDLRVGVSITPRLHRKIAARFALDVHQIPVGSAEQSYGLQGIEAAKLIHAGAELFVGNPLEISPLAVRAGYSQGFATAGFTVNLGFLAVDFATFGRDVSSTKAPLEDRRYMGSLSFEF